MLCPVKFAAMGKTVPENTILMPQFFVNFLAETSHCFYKHNRKWLKLNCYNFIHIVSLNNNCKELTKKIVQVASFKLKDKGGH